ncbi:DUF1541 domain-containing protein [Lysinibacillus yapensis]|uniref:DUF1541 domain-containing protein n=1 Tax=Ureibacillus yapensis TaxID=2304605 RepID=A0A396SCS1_9BACL|nr:YdhK family protein [Lysinibacillus yapensis]RHW37507.1 DUF1541 domain-containing protein [Lysinibacillus yapensis]
MANKMMIGMISFAAALTLTACSGDNKEEANQNDATQNQTTQEETNEMSGNEMEETDSKEDSEDAAMNHSSDGEVPEGLKDAEDPTFPVGSKAVIQADHMEGMNGAEATIVGAYDTIVYSVSYTPTNGGEPVKNHKWVIHEELEGVGNEPLEVGSQAKMNADHMEGMQGATATIDSAEETTVYMVDYTSTTGEEVKNHKWVTESELSAE